MDDWTVFEAVATSHVDDGGAVMIIRPLSQSALHGVHVSLLLLKFPNKGWTQVADVQFSLLPSWVGFAAMVRTSFSSRDAWAYLDASWP